MVYDMKKRDIGIDCLKGFATLLVVLGHIIDGYKNAGEFPDKMGLMSAGYKIIYAFHMPLFFMISGYVFQMAYFKDGKAKPGLKYQKLNIVVLFFEFGILFGLFKVLCGRFTNADVTLLDVALIWLKPISPYWYLYLLFFYYIIFSSSLFQAKRSSAVIGAVCLILSLLSSLIPSQIGAYFEIKHFLYHLTFFWFGIMLQRGEFNKFKSLSVGIAGAVIAVVLMIALRNKASSYQYIPGANIIIAYGISLFLYDIFHTFFNKEAALRTNALSFIGRYSLEIYVLHCIFTAGNRVILPKMHIHGFWLSIVCNMVISTAVPIIIALVCKKLNIHKQIFQPVKYLKEKKQISTGD